MDAPLSDTLGGTKLLPRADHARMRAWALKFGDSDPFGDFELLFAASELGLGIVDVPIRYCARRYGTTQIQRFRDGWQLLKLAGLAFVKIKLGKKPL